MQSKPPRRTVDIPIYGAVIGFCAAYVLGDGLGWPKLHYLPELGQWTFAPLGRATIAMGYVGHILWGVLGGTTAYLICIIARPLLDKTILQDLAGLWAIFAVVMASGYFLWSLWPFPF